MGKKHSQIRLVLGAVSTVIVITSLLQSDARSFVFADHRSTAADVAVTASAATNPSDASGSSTATTVMPAPATAETSTIAAPDTPTKGATVDKMPPAVATAGSRIYGLTLDDVSNISGTVQALKSLPVRPTVRVVFDETMAPGNYATALAQLRPVANIMGELLDSQYVAKYSTSAYLDRTKQYLDAFSNTVDIWEVGNEVNGEWLGTTSDVVAKISGAYDLVKQRRLKAALTLYYNPDCWESADHEMVSWTMANIPDRMKSGLDQVLISYYEGDCNNYRPSNWTPVFDKLRAMFPRSLLGFGEVGLSDPATSATLGKAELLMAYYYRLDVPTPGFIGGYFWWYAAEDCVPASKPLFFTLSKAID